LEVLAVAENEVENSRRLLVELGNTEDWGSGLFLVGEKEVGGGASTKTPPRGNSVPLASVPEAPSAPTPSASTHATVSIEEAGEVDNEELGEEEGNGEEKELEDPGVCVTQSCLMFTEQEEAANIAFDTQSQSRAQRVQTGQEQYVMLWVCFVTTNRV